MKHFQSGVGLFDESTRDVEEKEKKSTVKGGGPLKKNSEGQRANPPSVTFKEEQSDFLLPL